MLDHDVQDDTAFSLEALGHAVVKLREVLSRTAPDDEVLRLAGERGCVLITCNRDDFLAAAGRVAHHGLIILIRRKSRHWRAVCLVPCSEDTVNIQPVALRFQEANAHRRSCTRRGRF